MNGNRSTLIQFVQISHFREDLINLFTSNIEPLTVSETKISELRRTRSELEKMKATSEEQALLSQKPKTELVNDKKQATGDHSICKIN